MNALDSLWELIQNPDQPGSAGLHSVDRTWELLAMRTHRGYSHPGMAFLKDKLYLEGNLAQWNVLMRKPDLFPYLNLGKYDASNPDHIAVLCEANILPGKFCL